VLCKRLEEVGASAVMPLAAPIGTNKGLRTRDFLEIIIEQSQVPVVVDAGLGAPSHAADAMEMGADEIGMFINLGAVKDKDYDYVKSEIEEVRDSIDGKTLKVIVVSHKLDKEELIKVTEICNDTFVNYIEVYNNNKASGCCCVKVNIYLAATKNTV